MLSRISSFSGPFSKTFRISDGFTLGGLILRYELADVTSYSGSETITDLKGNSNATLVNGPTYSVNGYINFDGTNDYIVTSTSLNSKLLPINTSKIISHFTWVYPMDNGIIVTEIGTSSAPNLAGWHDSQVEVVSGVLKFRVWPSLSITSSIPISLYNWYYVGLTYDGSDLKSYVNGQLAGSVTGFRQTPYEGGAELHYALAATDITNLGDGTYARAKIGAFHVYNKSLSSQEVLNNYNSQKSNYIHTNDLLIWIDANDPQSYPGSGSTVTDISGNGYHHTLFSSPYVNNGGIYSFDCNSGYIRVNGSGPTLSTSGYTYVAWGKIKSSSSDWRTLYRSTIYDHALLVEVGTDNLGFYDNNTNGFKDSGYDVTSIEDVWVQYSVVGDSSSSTFYINDIEVGSASFGAGGNLHDYFGGLPSNQNFGYVGNMMLYDAKLTKEQITQNYSALKHVYGY
jgi:hypothetical protein